MKKAAPKQELIRGLHNIHPVHHGSVLTIGSFDGVHLGHQAILNQVLLRSLKLGLPSVVMIFEPQPHEFFIQEQAPARLMCFKEKVQALFHKGIDRVCCLPFNEKLSQQSADDFIQEVLVAGLGVKSLVIGDDFRFGADRVGDYAHLQAAGADYGFTVTDTQSLLKSGKRISSTRIRQLLQQNDFSKAAELLGRPYTISGRVVRGQQLGRELGAPTANVHLNRYRSPLSGVFAVEVILASQHVLQGVANVGFRPTLGGNNKPILEVHLFNYTGALYNQHITVEFKSKLREEQRFSSLDRLKQQIQKDIKQAQHFFS